MNKFRIYAVASIMLSFSGIALMSTEKTVGVAIMILGLIPTIIFLTKSKKEEKHPGTKTSKHDITPKREKKTILQYLISKIQENRGIQEIPRQNQKQEKKSIIQVVIERFKEKPATVEEIRQLRLQAEKYRLKADIAKSKAAISKGGKFNLGGSATQRSGLDESHSQEDKISGLLRGTVRTKDVDFFSNSDSKTNLFENKDTDDKSDKEKEAYRKRTLGL